MSEQRYENTWTTGYRKPLCRDLAVYWHKLLTPNYCKHEIILIRNEHNYGEQNNYVGFSETAAFQSYGVKYERKSQYAN